MKDISREIRDEGIMRREEYARFEAPPREYYQQAIENVLTKIDGNLEIFQDKVPAPASYNLVYEAIDNIYWTASFWSGMLWLAYEITGDAKYRRVAEAQLQLHRRRLEERVNIDTHDLGFLYSLSGVTAFKLTGNEGAKDLAVKAAESLSGRYWERAGIIQAWGMMDEPEERGRMIIDCLLNLPLLYWASEVTGNTRYREMAYNHVCQNARYIVRQDASTFHTFFLDVETGRPIVGKTHQGFSDDSCWARGQAWGIYGFPLSYRYTEDWRLIEVAKRLSNYFINRLPEDQVPYWDLIFDSGVERDSSAAAIACCGLLELSRHLPLADSSKRIYENAALSILSSLTDGYTTKTVPHSNGVLLHGLQHKPKGLGVDECCIWGDYYYFEALVRVVKDWKPYW